MDIFKQKRYLWYAVIFLVILNMATLTMLWYGNPGHLARSDGPIDPAIEQQRLHHLLQTELGFDETQIRRYIQLRRQHHATMQKLNFEIHRLKRQMFDQVLLDDPQPVLSDSLLKLVQEKQAMVELVTFQHFVELKKLCRPDQQENLKLLMHGMFRQGAPPGMQDGRPPLRQREGKLSPPLRPNARLPERG